METPLTLNNARIHNCLFLLFIQKFVLEVKAHNLGCNIVETAASVASNDAPYRYER